MNRQEDGWCCEIGVPVYKPKAKSRNVNDMARYIFDRTQRIFEYRGMENERITWTKRELELLIQINGCCVITAYQDKLWALRGALGGEPDAYYMPQNAIVANPYLGLDATLRIGEDCCVIPNDSTYRGLVPLVSKYASLIVEAELSLHMYSIFMRTPVIIAGDKDTTRESARVFVQHLEDGDLDIVANRPFLDGVKTLPFSATGTGRITDLIEYRQYLWGTFLNELGLKAAYNMKREALSDDEVSVNDLSLTPLIENMLETRKLALEKVNAMYGTNLSVELSGAWDDLRTDIDNDLDPDEPAGDPEPEGGDDNDDDTEDGVGGDGSV